MLTLIILIISFESKISAQERREIPVVSVDITGNEHVATEYILSVVRTKPGTVFNRETIQRDIEVIMEQGFFIDADFSLSRELNGVHVTFSVKENPLIKSVNFEGNTIYTAEQLKKGIFSYEGNVFNTGFFRSDLDRIQDFYHKNGYEMVRITDVTGIETGNIIIHILEPKLGDIIIQGNVKTKLHVIRREIKMKQGEVLNVSVFRHQISKLRGLGYFEDVGATFDYVDSDGSVVDIIITVKEKRTASIGVNVGYGTESGLSGGLTYSDSNLRGLGYNLEVGFDEGDEASYWVGLSSSYSDFQTFAWRVGARYMTYDDRYYYRTGRRQFEFDEKSLSFYAGFGKKFKNEDWSWFLTFRHTDTDYSDVHNAIPGYIDDLTKWQGVNQTIEFQLTWDRREPYIPFQKGYVWDSYLEQAIEALGGEYSYFKYWTQARFYIPLNDYLKMLTDTKGTWTDENPLMLAARFRIGSATENDLPAFARYSLGGMNTLRGYNSRSYEGSDMYLGNIELRVPLNSMFTVVGFYDFGYAGETMVFDETYDDSGIGLRVTTPFGKLRVDYAKGDYENRTYFGFGEMF